MRSICSSITTGRTSRRAGCSLFRAARPPGVREVPIGISVQKLACDVPFVVKLAALMMRKRYDVIHAVEEAVFRRGGSESSWSEQNRLRHGLVVVGAAHGQMDPAATLGPAVPTPRAQRRAPLRGGVARLRGPGRQGSAMDGPPTGDRAAGRAGRRISRRHCGRVAAQRRRRRGPDRPLRREISSTTRALTCCSTRCPGCRRTAA